MQRFALMHGVTPARDGEWVRHDVAQLEVNEARTDGRFEGFRMALSRLGISLEEAAEYEIEMRRALRHIEGEPEAVTNRVA